MPTVYRFDGLRVIIYPNDHRPEHVHVIGPAGEVVFLLNCPDGPLELRESFGFRLTDVKRIGQSLDRRVKDLCEEWSRHHGR